jgi:hypothetical protein
MLIFIGMLGGTSMLFGQASATATRALDIQIGGGYSYVTPDTEPVHYNGGAAYIDFNFRAHFGVEGQFHFATDSLGTGKYEKTYEIGGRYFRTYGRLLPYAKLMYGRGVYNFVEPFQANPPNGPFVYEPVANLAYNLVAGGAGVDYMLLRHVNLRADWEYQHWFNYEGSALSPNLLTVGAAYHF